MIAKGTVTRASNPKNRRQTIISLTDTAKSMKEKYENVSAEMGTLFYEGFTQEETTLFESYLERILQTLTQKELELKTGIYQNKQNGK